MERALKSHARAAESAAREGHLDFDAFYALANDDLEDAKRLHAETHLAACEACRMQLNDLKKSIALVTTYDPDYRQDVVPERILGAMPKPKSAQGALAKLTFTKNQVLRRVQGVPKSMGGIVEDLSDFVVETLLPDAAFLTQTRSVAHTASPDYQVNYRGYEIIFSVLLEQNTLEIHLKSDGKNIVELKRLNVYLVDDADAVFEPESVAVTGKTLKLIFTKLAFESKNYEMRLRL